MIRIKEAEETTEETSKEKFRSSDSKIYIICKKIKFDFTYFWRYIS